MKTFEYCKVISIAGALAGLLAWPGIGQAQLGDYPDVPAFVHKMADMTGPMRGIAGRIASTSGNGDDSDH